MIGGRSNLSRKIYIVLSDTSTLLSRTIQLYTRQEYNHVSISFDPLLKEMYSFGRKKENNPFNGGFVHENTGSKIFREANCLIYTCHVTDEQYTQLRNTINHFLTYQDAYKYNFLGLIALACHFKVKRSNAYFCSQFIATLFEMVGLPLYEKNSYFMKPYDFSKLPYLELYYKGNFQDFIDSDVELAAHNNSILAIKSRSSITQRLKQSLLNFQSGHR